MSTAAAARPQVEVTADPGVYRLVLVGQPEEVGHRLHRVADVLPRALPAGVTSCRVVLELTLPGSCGRCPECGAPTPASDDEAPPPCLACGYLGDL